MQITEREARCVLTDYLTVENFYVRIQEDL